MYGARLMMHHAPAPTLPAEDVGGGQCMQPNPFGAQDNPGVTVEVGNGVGETDRRRLLQDVEPAGEHFGPTLTGTVAGMDAGDLLPTGPDVCHPAQISAGKGGIERFVNRQQVIFGVDFIRHPGIITSMIMNCINTLRLNREAMRLNSLLCAGMTLGMLSACTAMQQPAGPSVAPPQATGSHFLMADGYQLPYTQSVPPEPRAVVIALHGFNDHRRAWAEPADRWSRQGIAVYAYDQRGFGETRNRGIWPGVPTLTQDLASVVTIVQARHPGLPVHLVGESMGGAVVMAALGSTEPPRVASAVLSAPAVWSRKTMTGFARWALDFFSSTMPGYTATGAGLGVRASDNDMVLRAMGADPLFIKATRFDTVSGLVDLMDAAYNAVPAIRVPLLVLYGRRDQIVPCQAVQMTLERFHEAPDLAVYDDGWHLLFRDLQGPIVQHDVGHWLLRPDSRLPSGSGGGTVADLCARPEPTSRLASANG